VKSTPVYFYVQLSEHYNQTKIPIPFDIEQLNVGGAFQTGIFTAPRAGKYFFSFSGLVYFPGSLSSTSRIFSRIQLFKNGGFIGSCTADETGAGEKYETTSLQSTLNLQNGDQIWLIIDDMVLGALLHGGGRAHFNGFLLEEEIVQSVKLNIL
jgi:hypothetical protein